MKNKFLKSIQILGASAVLLSCSNLSDLNEDPNSYYTTQPSSLVTYAQKSLADYLSTPSVNTNNFRLTMQYWQETTYTEESNYDFFNRNISNNVWFSLYVNSLQNFVQAKKIISDYKPTPAEESTWPGIKQNELAIIDLQQAFIYQNLVDTYGDVPYSKSNDLENNPLPAYDKASDIYVNLISRVKNDISKLDENSENFGDADIFYQGNVSKWKKFGNSLLLKLGITIADVNPALAQSTVNDAVLGGVFTSSDDNALVHYQTSAPYYSQLYANLKASGRNDFVAGKTLVDYMNASSDVRRSAYFTKVNGNYIGATIGSGASFTARSHIGAFAYDPVTPGIVMNYTEVAFYLAEAAARWSPATAATAYATAIKASFAQWGYTDADADAYIALKPFDSVNWKKSIGEQAWVAMFDQGSTSFNFWRRLDYPILVAPSTAVSQAEGKVPVRLTYPVRETTTNPTNYSNASTSIGGDKLTTKVFWDKF